MERDFQGIVLLPKVIPLNGVRGKIFQSIDLFYKFYHTQMMSVLCQKCKNIGCYRLRFGGKACGKQGLKLMEFDGEVHFAKNQTSNR